MPNREYFELLYDLRMSAESEEAEILVYGRITQYKGDDNDPDVTAKDFDKMLKEAKAKGAKRLNLRINSPGGAVFQAVAMRTMLMNAGFDELKVSIEGMCASAATFLACVPGTRVSIGEGSMYMIHNPSSITWGDARVMEKEAEVLRKIEENARNIYAGRSGKSEDELKDLMDDETWFTAQEAIDAGFADELIDGSEAAACVTMNAMDTMRGMYRHVPDGIVIEGGNEEDNVSNAKSGTEPAAAPENTKTNEEEHSMDMKDITGEQLMQERPDLFKALNEAGAKAERERMQEIDELTPPGYEEMAAEAKKNGESAMDYHKRVVKAQREKATEFLEKRNKETAGSKEVTGGATSDLDGDEAKMLDEHAKEIAAYAKAYHDAGAGTMF